MKKMSKLLAVMLVLVMVLAMFAGCENTDKPATEAPKPDTTAGNEPVKTDAPVTEAPPATDAPKPAVTNQIIYGTTTELSGDLGNAWWTNNAADKTLRDLIDDYDVVVTNQSGEFVYNDTVVKEVKSEENEDGTKTYTVTINEGLKYNNGDPITAADFVAYELVALSPATKEDGAKTTAEIIVGGTEYQNGEAKFISGLRLLDEYTYAITISKDYLPYYFDMTYASLRPIALKQYASAPLVVKDDGEGAYLDGGELKKEEIDAARWIYTDRISAGPYVLAEFDQASLTATLKINPNYNGNFEGQKPSVETILIVKANQETMLDALKTGSIDFLSTLTDGDQVNAALDLQETGDFTTVSYERNGYGKLMFQCDFGPTQFKAVRHAVAYLLDRNEFAKQFCQGYGSVVDGPYGLAMWMYQDAEDELAERLNTYAYSVDSAIAELEADGWTLNEKGEPYTEGIRYKEVTAEEAGDYKHNVTLDDGRILMPLIIEWSSSEGNSVSELLAVMLANGEQTAKAGMQINQNIMSFDDLLNYMYRDSSVGEQYGVKTYGMYNLATNFTAAYDMSFNYCLPGTKYYEMGYNSNFTNSKELDDLSMNMVYGVEAGDSEQYLKLWVDFIDEWNDYLPEVPLYSNIYYDVMAAKIHNLECNALWDFQQAVVYATIE
ncbi:MAG: ABC transporter substrate-binding protein [Oscillospiraceae bacterium]|nr:ABC transporter substrate-binding protein [Oscillospiraceae bacterium]